MYTKNSIVFCQLLLLVVCSAKAVKIGISKPLPMTTTQPPNIRSLETTTEEDITENPSTTSMISTTTTLKTTTSTTTSTTKTSTAKPTNTESEWPEFPPRKNSKAKNKTTTIKPFTTTNKTPTTTTTSSVTNEITNTTEKPEIPTMALNKWFFEEKYCFCDLNMDICDMNCCCDRDCSLEALKVFRCLKEEPLDLELHEGRFEDFKFQHGLPSCEINDGWLCVFRTNKPPIKKEIALTYADTSHYYQWPNLLLEAELTENRDFYKFGDILKMINVQTKDIQNFDLPSTFKSPFCQIREPIYYLKNFKRSCLMSSNNDKSSDIQATFLQLQEKYKIIKKPLTTADFYNSKNLAVYTGNIMLQQCHESLRNCSKIKRRMVDENVQLTKVKVNILHNFTNIQEVVMELWLKDNPDLNGDVIDESWLEYEVEFLNKTLKDVLKIKDLDDKPFFKKHIISGPLGYLQGKPLILAKYVPFNNTLPLSSKNQVLNYFYANNSDSNTLSLINKHQGICQQSKNFQDLISFGINEAKQCKIRLEDDILLTAEPSKMNFTQICLNLQDLIHKQLFGTNVNLADLSSYFISQLGKPQNNSNKWINLEVFNMDFNSVYGQYLEDTNTFICRNILLSLSYEFHIATYMVDDVPLQNILKHAVLNLGERHDLEFALDENLEVPITLTVRFYDMHEKAASVSTYNGGLTIEFFIVSLVLYIME